MISWEKIQITSTEFSVNFNGLVSPNGKACHESHNWNDQSCQWDNPPDQPDPGALGTMFTAISVTCTYDAAKETAWSYGSTLGQRDEILANDDSWSFDTYTCTVQAGGGCFNVGVPRLTHGTGMRLGNSSQGKVRMRGEYPLTPDSNYDLRQASLEIEQLIFEPGNTGKGELVLNENTEPVAPLTLVPKRNSKRWNAVFETAAGEKPRVRVQLLLRNEKDPWDIVQPVLQMNVRVDGSAIDAPVLCEVGEGSAELQTALRLRVGEADEPLLSKQVWNCYTRHDGTIGMLVAVKAPPVTRPPEVE